MSERPPPRVHDPELLREIAKWAGTSVDDAAPANDRLAERENSEIFRIAIEQAGDGIALTDNQGRFVFMNELHATMFGYENKDALLGLPWSVLYMPEEMERFAGEVFPLLDGPGKRWRGNAYGVAKDGRTVRQEVSLTILQTGGILCITRDIGARIDADSQRRRLMADLDRAQRMQSVGAVASGLGHDLCNILTAVGSVIDLERSGGADPADSSQRLDSLRQWIDQATRLAQRLHRLGTTGATIGGRTELGASVESAVELVRSGLGPDTRVQVRATDQLASVPVDDSTVAQILVNLVVNARDAGKPGSPIAIEVAAPKAASTFSSPFADLAPARLHRVSAGTMPRGDVALLRVVDQGTGIAPEFLDRVLEPFFTTKSEGKGTGLGLPTVVAAVRDAGGLLEIYSAEGVGTEVRVWLPRLGATPMELIDAGEIVVSVADHELARAIDASLSAAGASLRCCSAHHALLERLGQSKPIAAILVDVATLPEPVGMRLDMLRTLGDGRPLVAIVGEAVDDARVAALKERCDGVLRQPFSGDRLVRALTEILARRVPVRTSNTRAA